MDGYGYRERDYRAIQIQLEAIGSQYTIKPRRVMGTDQFRWFIFTLGESEPTCTLTILADVIAVFDATDMSVWGKSRHARDMGSIHTAQFVDRAARQCEAERRQVG